MPRYLYIETKALDHPECQRILRTLPNRPIWSIEDHRRLDTETVPLRGYNPRIKSQVLILAHHPGPFIRPFPGTAIEAGRKQFYIAHANGCPFDCQYCFLQAYFDHGAQVLFVNQEALIKELEAHLGRYALSEPAVYHAGEFSDALSPEPYSGFVGRAVNLFRAFPLAQLELRTKTINVDPLLPDKPPDNVIISWTLSPEQAWQYYEKGTPHPIARLKSARTCQDMGYRIGIRLDPALIYSGWQQGYERLIRQIFEYLRPDRIEAFVISCFRYPPYLAARIRERFPSSDLLLCEFVPCQDGKFRYFRPTRVLLYRKIIEAIRKYDKTARIRLTMETEQIHDDCFMD